MPRLRVREVGPEARRAQRRAWLSVGLCPVGLVAAMVIGEGLLALQGYEVGAEQAPPWGPALLAAIPAMAAGALPGVLALRFGLQARSQGHPRGWLPAAIGVAIGVAFVVLNFAAAVVGGR